MHAFVTCSTGFIDSTLVSRLLKEDHSISVLDKQPGIAADRLKREGIEISPSSVTNREAKAKDVTGAKVVIHLTSPFREKRTAEWYKNERYF